MTHTYRIEYKGFDRHYTVLWHFLLDHLFTLYRILKTTGDLNQNPQFIIQGVKPGHTDRLHHFYSLLTDTPLLINAGPEHPKTADYELGQVLGSIPNEQESSLIYLAHSEKPVCHKYPHIVITDCYKNFRKQDKAISEELVKFKAHVLEKLGIVPNGNGKNILLVKRKNENIYGRNENRAYNNENEFINALKQLPFPLTHVYLEDYSPVEQITMIASHQLMICPIGSSSSLSVFLPEKSSLLLLFPPDLCYPLSRILCDHLNLNYFDLSPNRPSLTSDSTSTTLEEELARFETLLKDPKLFSHQLNKNLNVDIESVVRKCREFLSV